MVYKKIQALIIVGLVGNLSATDMDHKAKTIRTVHTRWAGIAEVTCNDPGDRMLTQGLNRVDVPPCGYLKVEIK